MNQLDSQRINSRAPYQVKQSDDENFFEFFTEHDVHYSVGFMPDAILMQNEAYHLIIVNVDNRPSPSDRKVKNTVLAIVAEFFEQNNTTLLYICDTGDGKQRLRSRLFEQWFAAYKQKALYTSVTSSVVDEDGIMNYATIILRNDNPRLVETISEFTTTVSLLNQKPSYFQIAYPQPREPTPNPSLKGGEKEPTPDPSLKGGEVER